MSARTLFISKIIIFAIILGLTAFIGYAVFIQPNSSNPTQDSTNNDENSADINPPIADYCPYYFPDNCQKGYLEGATACVDFSDDVLITYYCCPENKVLSGGKCVDKLPTCSSLGTSACQNNPLSNGIECSGPTANLFCCPTGYGIASNQNTCISNTQTPEPTPTDPRNVPEGGTCAVGGPIECISGICCGCNKCLGSNGGTCDQLCATTTPTTPTTPDNTDNGGTVTPTPDTGTGEDPTTPTPTTPTPDTGTDSGTTDPTTPEEDTNTDTTTDENTSTTTDTATSGTTDLPDTAIEFRKEEYVAIYGIILILYGITFSFLAKRLRA